MSRTLARPIDEPEHSPAAEVRAVVALGANLGDRAETIRLALVDLDRMPLTHVVASPEPLESIAVTLAGPDAQAPTYLNTVALIHTRLAPTVLLAHLHAIEARHGRERRERWGDRTLDLDLIVYGDAQIDSPTLTVPHPRTAERDFVLEPWLRVDPDAEVPGVGRVADLLAALRAGERQ